MMVNKSSKSQTLCGLLVAALMVATPVMAAAGEFAKQEPLKLQENPLKKIEEAPALFEFKVPVTLLTVHPYVDKAEVLCMVGKKKYAQFQLFPTVKDVLYNFEDTHVGAGRTEIPMLVKAPYSYKEYKGPNITVFITKMNKGSSAWVDGFICWLQFQIAPPPNPDPETLTAYANITAGDTEKAAQNNIDPAVVKAKMGPTSLFIDVGTLPEGPVPKTVGPTAPLAFTGFGVKLKQMDESDYQLSEQKGPDLTVSAFWVETIHPGEKLPNDKPATKKYWYFIWKVQNIGNKIASSSKLKVTCTAELVGSVGIPSSCPPGVVKEYEVKQLWPKPDQISGAHVLWDDPVPAPLSHVKYKFTAIVDPDNQISEKNEGNNTLISEFDSAGPVSFKVSKADEIVGKLGPKEQKKLGSSQVMESGRSRLRESKAMRGRAMAKRTPTRPPKPKLEVVSLSTSPRAPKAGDTLTLSFVIQNKGNAPSTETSTVHCTARRGGPCPFDNLRERLHPPLKPDESRRVTIAKPAPAGDYQVWVRTTSGRSKPLMFRVAETPPATGERTDRPSPPTRELPTRERGR